MEYFGLLTGRDENAIASVKFHATPPKIMGTYPQNYGDLPPKSWGLTPKIMGTELPKFKQRKSNENIGYNWDLQRKKANTPTIVEGYFALYLTDFFPSVKKKTSPITALPSLPVGSHKARTMQRPLHDVILSVSRIDGLRFSRPVFCQLSHPAPMHT